MLFYFDPLYIILTLPAFIFCIYAQSMVNSSFKKYSSVRNIRGITGSQAAEAVMRANGVYGVRIERTGGKLSDHYDPKSNVIRLSNDVYDSTSIAAVGVAAHEAGHAVQHAQQYFPLSLRNAIIPVCNIGSRVGVYMVILGMIFSSYINRSLGNGNDLAAAIINIGLILFFTTVIFQLVTLPVEFNASRRAIKSIQSQNLLTPDECTGASRVLTAAAMTYVAALASAITQFIYLFIRANNNRRR